MDLARRGCRRPRASERGAATGRKPSRRVKITKLDGSKKEQVRKDAQRPVSLDSGPQMSRIISTVQRPSTSERRYAARASSGSNGSPSAVMASHGTAHRDRCGRTSLLGPATSSSLTACRPDGVRWFNSHGAAVYGGGTRLSVTQGVARFGGQFGLSELLSGDGAAFQRAKVRDLYDLHLLARQKFDGDLLRGLVVLKLWQVRDAFDPPGFFTKLRGGEYDWEDLHRLLRPSERMEQETIVAGIELHFRKLKELTELEAHVVADAKKGARNEPLGGRLRAEIRDRFARL